MAAKKARKASVSRPGRSKKLSSEDKLPAATMRALLYEYRCTLILVGGIGVRLVVFAYMGFFNNDNHIIVIDYVSRY